MANSTLSTDDAMIEVQRLLEEIHEAHDDINGYVYEINLITKIENGVFTCHAEARDGEINYETYDLASGSGKNLNEALNTLIDYICENLQDIKSSFTAA